MKEISFALFLLISACGSMKKGDPTIDRIEAKKYLFRECYLGSDAYTLNKRQKGELLVGFRLTELGAVEQAKVLKSDFKDANLSACVLMVIRDLRFDPPNDGNYKDVTFPLKFKP